MANRGLWNTVGLASEPVTAAAVYARTIPVDFSRDVLAVQPERLSVLEAPSMGWTDLGRADRVLALRREMPASPASNAEIRAAS